MALTPCRDCGRSISTDAMTCPSCGSHTAHRKQVEGRMYAVGAAIFVATILFLWIVI